MYLLNIDLLLILAFIVRLNMVNDALNSHIINYFTLKHKVTLKRRHILYNEKLLKSVIKLETTENMKQGSLQCALDISAGDTHY